MSYIGSSPLGLTLDTKIPASPIYSEGVSIPSQFNHPNENTIVFTPWPIGPVSESGDPASRRNIHSDDIYKEGVSNIISSSDKIFKVEKGVTHYPTKLKASDFAYLKNVGVFPNNRLMIARRFPSPIIDDLTQVGQNPISTMISWVPEGQDYITLDFGEEWTVSKASFTDIFNEVGKYVGGGEIGGMLSRGLDAVPLPGFTEILQRRIMEKILKISTTGSSDFIPSGEPNLIKEAKQRKTVDPDDAGSGLKGKVSIKMVCEWEQKFIAGVDPSIAWMDIIQTCLAFGTSDSKFYLGQTVASRNFIDFIQKLTTDPMSAMQDVIQGLIDAITPHIAEMTNIIEGKSSKSGEPSVVGMGSLLDFFKNAGSDILSGIAKKFKVKIIGIVYALTGAASTPWHITIGNPLRPVFSSGDMLCEEVKMTMGDILAFNDLPSTIKVEFTLTNARNWGMQEILSKFNVGYMRTVKSKKKDLYSSDNSVDFIPPSKDVIGGGKDIASQGGSDPVQIPNSQNPSSESGGWTTQQTEDTPGSGTVGTGNSYAGNTDVDNKSTNPDPHSTDVITPEYNPPSIGG